MFVQFKAKATPFYISIFQKILSNKFCLMLKTLNLVILIKSSEQPYIYFALKFFSKQFMSAKFQELSVKETREIAFVNR